MQELKSFAVLPTAKAMGALYLIFGAIVSVFVAIAALAGGRPGQAVLMLILMGPLYGVGGFIMTVITAWLYNQVAARIGGIEIELAPRSSV
jgi:hypothetical protein